LPCASNSVRRARPLLGTFVEIMVADAGVREMHGAVDAAFRAVSAVHGLMSFHDADSDIGRLNREAGRRPVDVHSWTFQVLEAAIGLHGRSRGAFDVAVAPILQDIGWLPPLPDGSTSPAGSATTEAIALLPDGRVRFEHADLRIDLGGIAKGFAVDRAILALRDHGMPCGLVNAGGDLASFGPNAHSVHIRDPHDPSRLLLRLQIANRALASSGRRIDPFRSRSAAGTAVIDPRTRTPVRTIGAATVCAPSCMLADALTKVVMVAGESAAPLLEHYGAGALMVLSDGGVQMTEDLRGAVYRAA
jgi:thiamine biosynthesis lipoprotein